MGVFKEEHTQLQDALKNQFVISESIMLARNDPPKPQQKTALPQQTPEQKRLELSKENLAEITKKMPAALALLDKKEEALFDVIKGNGKLGIRFELSEERPPYSPDEVMKNKNGDCDELSLLFIAALRQMEGKGFDPKRYAVVLMDFTNKDESGVSHSYSHLVILRKSDNKLFDPSTTVGIHDVSSGLNEEKLGPLYTELGKITSIRVFDIGNLDSFHYRETGRYQRDVAKNWEEAYKAFKLAYAANKEDPFIRRAYTDSLLNLISTDLNKNNLNGAIAYLEEASSLKKDNEQQANYDDLAGKTHTKLGNSYVMAKEYTKAKLEFEEAITHPHEEMEADYIGLAYIYHKSALQNAGRGAENIKAAIDEENKAKNYLIRANEICGGTCINAQKIKSYMEDYDANLKRFKTNQ